MRAEEPSFVGGGLPLEAQLLLDREGRAGETLWDTFARVAAERDMEAKSAKAWAGAYYREERRGNDLNWQRHLLRQERDDAFALAVEEEARANEAWSYVRLLAECVVDGEAERAELQDTLQRERKAGWQAAREMWDTGEALQAKLDDALRQLNAQVEASIDARCDADKAADERDALVEQVTALAQKCGRLEWERDEAHKGMMQARQGGAR